VRLGRTTTPSKVLVRKYVERWRRLAKLLPSSEGEALKELLKDVDETASLATHVGVADPLEVMLIHVVRQLIECRRAQVGRVEGDSVAD
jgi:hypothetical protein